jgi:hypothetical protein
MSRTALDPRLPWRTPPIDPRDSLLHGKAACSLAATPNIPQNIKWLAYCKPWGRRSKLSGCSNRQLVALFERSGSQKGSRTLNVILRQGTSQSVRLRLLPVPLGIAFEPTCKAFLGALMAWPVRRLTIARLNPWGSLKAAIEGGTERQWRAIRSARQQPIFTIMALRSTLHECSEVHRKPRQG